MAELMPWEDPPTVTARTKEPMPWEDSPVESVQSKVVSYYMPEPPGAPKIAVEPVPVPPGFGQRLYEQTLQGPVELAKGLWSDPKGTLAKTLATMTATQIQAAQHPMTLQPQSPVVPIIEDVRAGNIPGAIGGGLGLATTVVGMERVPSIIRGTVRGAKAAPEVTAGGLRGAYQAAKKTPSAAEYTATTAAGLFGGPAAAAKTAAALRTGRILTGAVQGAREALNARALRAAEALAAERAAAEQAATAARPQPIPEARRIESPPDTSYVRAVPAEPLPPSRQLPPPGRPPIVTPPPDPLAGDTSGVRAVPAVYGSSAVNEAAAGVREAMGLQPGELTPPATRTAPVTARASQIDAMARHMRQAGITAEQATLLDPPDLAALAQAAGIEGPLGKVAVRVRKRLAAMEKAEAETAKYQAAYDKLKPAEKAAVRGEGEAGATAAAETPATPAEANAELGRRYPAPEQVETRAAPTKPEARIQGLAEMLAAGELPTDKLAAGLESDANARLYLEQRSKDLGYGSPGPGEIPKIIDKVRELRGEGVKPSARSFDPDWFGKSKAVDESGAPVRVYHGTQASFDKFSPQAIQEGAENGFFFTDSPSMAGKYAETYKHTPGKVPPPPFQTPPGANVRPAYLKMENPLVKDFQGKSKYEGYEQMIARAKAAGHDGLILRNIDDPVPGEFYSPTGGAPHDVYIVFDADQIRPAFGKAMAQTETAAFQAAKDVIRKPPAEAKAIVEKAQRARRAAKSPATMSATEINKRLDQLDQKSSLLTDQMIEAGRGQERPSDYAKKTDPLSMEINVVANEFADLRAEMSRRYGPNVPSRLPRGFGPIK